MIKKWAANLVAISVAKQIILFTRTLFGSLFLLFEMASFMRNGQLGGDSGDYQLEQDNEQSNRQPQIAAKKQNSVPLLKEQTSSSPQLEQICDVQEESKQSHYQNIVDAVYNQGQGQQGEFFNEVNYDNVIQCGRKVKQMLEEVTSVIASLNPSQKNFMDCLKKFQNTNTILDNQFSSILSHLKSPTIVVVKPNAQSEQKLSMNQQNTQLGGNKQSNPKEITIREEHTFQPQTHETNILQTQQKSAQQNQQKLNLQPKKDAQIQNDINQQLVHVVEMGDRQIDCSLELNKRYLVLLVTVIVPYLESSHECLRILRNKTLQVRKPQSYLNDLIISESKLNTISEFMPFALLIQENDIYNCEIETCPIWSELRQKSIESVQITDASEIESSLNGVYKTVMLGNAMAAKGAERTSEPGQWLQRNLSSLYYLCNPRVTQRKATIFFSQPDPKTAISVWNTLDETFMQHAMKIILPSIQYHKNIFIPRAPLQFTKQAILAGIAAGNLNSISPPGELKQQPPQDISNPSPTSHTSSKQRKNLFHFHPDRVKVRILCSQDLHPPGKGHNVYKSIALHIHGGGFVAMGSKSHQVYTRQWANLLNIPIFSIDYRKAPQHPYPEGLDDCFSLYQWIVNHVHEFFNIIPEKIIIVGDSAGGNLGVALTQLCIKYQVRIPDGVLALYPVLNLNLRQFTPSYFLALEDLILPHTFLKISLNAYLSDPEIQPAATSDPFLSPLIVSDEILKQFPPIRMQSGTKDPLSDHSIRFLHRLQKIGKDAKLVVYNGMPHGYLNYDAPGGMKEAKRCVLDGAEQIRELLSK